ncbi:MAG TPA: M23 family metallopeptidase [Candidatus Binataceae bacterium]|nr:M23 family metallopeptidase [Candidatus Binataceae bacterium]
MGRKRNFNAIVFAQGMLMLVLFLAGCASTPPAAPEIARQPVTHTVQSGDTLYRIAHEYGVSVGRLMAANGIGDPRELRTGRQLIIPGAYATVARDSSGAYPFTGERADRRFSWPIARGVVSSGFGMRNGAMHAGLNIDAPSGTPVRAAGAGTVIFSGTLPGYGNTVIIRHDDHYATVYGHNERNLVREGTQVEDGQEIAEVGSTGRAATANLHFEVRRDNIAKDPLAYLPPAPAGAIAFAGDGGS